MKKNKWIIVGIVVVFGLIGWCVGSYNRMLQAQETATTSLSDLEATYQRRADLLPNFAKTVKSYAKHENETFTQVAQARAAASQVKLDASDLTPEKIKAYQEAQGQISAALGKLMAVSERYPELKADKSYENLQVELEGCENRINEARQKYNAAVQDYNICVRRFPNVLIAGAIGFDKMAKFEASAGAEKAPELDI